jgi:hypothetical protein
MERKSFELYVQTANWTGGIAAAASGGIFLALINHDTPPGLITWLRWIGISLLVALGAAAYVQFHAIGVLNAHENSKTDLAKKRGGYVAISQWFMFGGLAVAALGRAQAAGAMGRRRHRQRRERCHCGDVAAGFFDRAHPDPQGR